MKYEMNLLFQDENDFVLVLINVFEVDDAVGLGAGRQHGDLVHDLHRAVHAAPDARRELGRVHDAAFAVRTFAYGRKKAAETKKQNLVVLFDLMNHSYSNSDHI
jgi:hypothetical protein